MQLTSTRAYVERVVFYLARLYVGQLEKGNPYTLLARTIGISLVDFVLFPDLEDLHTRYSPRASTATCWQAGVLMANGSPS